MLAIPEFGRPKPSNFNVPPLFFDVLCGEFRPPHDLRGFTHTLGRLSVRAYEAGERVALPESGIQVPPLMAGIRAYRYTPSWAGNVQATTITDYYPLTPSMAGIVLEAPESTLAIFSEQDDDRRHGVRLELPDGSSSFTPLVVGHGLNDIRDSITAGVQTFFDEAARKT